MNQVEVRFTAGSNKATRDRGKSWKTKLKLTDQPATLKTEY